MAPGTLQPTAGRCGSTALESRPLPTTTGPLEALVEDLLGLLGLSEGLLECLEGLLGLLGLLGLGL